MLNINDLSITSVFGLLLSDEEAALWKAYKTEDPNMDNVKPWFIDTFMIKKSVKEMTMKDFLDQSN